ncbi:Bacterio-opsin activator HTH domain protein [Halorubrum kocurii JCM 14978]|uniref:Bacterio-opsin activator HTH domain protein n=1 Tax=Halorubrum kocurii JCM 14978 TaxID=1230456 RepID=M0P6A6_9EURY|nr:Bacterio-opsin activator HTH domain protein [Halorubrum kocurii JCM 14978]
MAALREHDRVDRVDVVDKEGPATRVRLVSDAPPPHVAAAREVGLPIEAPVSVTDGRASLDAVGERSRLTAFGRRLTAEGITVAIKASDADAEPVLTDAQRELVLAAVAAGYYDTPRECTLTELAEARGLAKSTCSETLHRAEGQVLRRFVAGECAGDDPVQALDGERAIGDEADPDRERDRAESAEAAAPGP